MTEHTHEHSHSHGCDCGQCGHDHNHGSGQSTGQEDYDSGVGNSNKTFGGSDAMGDLITRNGVSWGSGQGFGNSGGNVTYSFSADGQSGTFAMGAAGRAMMVEAFRIIQEVADITFSWADSGNFNTTNSNNGDIKLREFDGGLGGVGGWGAYGSGEIYTGSVRVSGVNLSLYLHEVMHALGMSHPGEYNGGGFSYARDAAYWDDTTQYTLMSYWDPDETGANWNDFTQDGLMLYDIAALQRMYGANTTTRSGDTVYGFNSNTGDDIWELNNGSDDIKASVWDAGGTDTIDLSGFSSGSEIDLREEGFSSFGGLTNNFSIARGVTIENASGGSGDDVVEGNGTANSIEGGAGSDTLRGNGGNDDLRGGAGSDDLEGGTGNDILRGGAGGDALEGGPGRDYASYSDATSAIRVDMNAMGSNTGFAAGDTFTGIENIVGSAFSDTIAGNGGGNILLGRSGSDELVGRGGADRLEGGSGNDTLRGGSGADLLLGGDGNDILFGDAGGDALNGGRGFDYVSYTASTSGIVLDIRNPSANAGDAAGDKLYLIENLVGSNFADTIRGGNVQNELLGRGGNDVIEGRAGADLIDGGGGADVLTGGTGFDTFRYQLAGESLVSARDTITDFSGQDTIDLSAVDADVNAGGNQAFAFIGAAAFSGDAGELRFSGGQVQADLNGDGSVDFAIDMVGVNAMSAGDFVL